MKAQDLKNSILQLAIQGKLVEQREEEGTAKELIAKITAEKERLIKEQKIKKETALDELTEEDIPFDIPPNWEWVKLGEVVSVNGGKRMPAGRALTDEDTGYKYIRVADMKNGSILLDGIKYIPHDIYPKIKNYTISKDDIYITVAGTIGQVGLVPEELDNANLTENADKLVIYSNFKEFMYYMLSSNFIQYQIKEHTTKVGQPKLAIKRIKELIVPLPPLEEQKRIVAKIEELLPYVDQYDKAYTEVEELNKKFPEDMQKSILQYAIQGKLVEQREEDGTAEELYQIIQAEKEKLIKEGKIKKTKPLPEITEDEIPFDIPESWKWVRFNDISCIHGTGLVRSNYEQFQKADYEYFKMNNIENFTGSCNLDNMPMIYATEEEYKRYKLEEGDFLFNTRNSRELVGKTAVVQNISDRKIILNNNILKISFHRNISSKYINYYFISPLGRDQLRKFITNTTNVAAIYQKQLITLMIPIPPFEEQKRIAERIEELFPYTKQLVKKLD